MKKLIALLLAVVMVFGLAACGDKTPVVFMGVIMLFLTLILGVLTAVMAAAVDIREENDLTV